MGKSKARTEEEIAGRILGVLECWSVGVLECRSVGVLECRSVGVLEFNTFTLYTFTLLHSNTLYSLCVFMSLRPKSLSFQLKMIIRFIGYIVSNGQGCRGGWRRGVQYMDRITMVFNSKIVSRITILC